MASNVREISMSYKWTDEDVGQLIRLRGECTLFTGKRFAAAAGWEAVIEGMGRTGVLTPARAAKKWENLKKTYTDLLKPPTGAGTESGEATTWKWFSLMEEAIGRSPSIRPPLLIASVWSEGPSTSRPVTPDSGAPSPNANCPDPAAQQRPPKRRSTDALLQHLERAEERAEERARRSEEREERMLSLLEKIVEKF